MATANVNGFSQTNTYIDQYSLNRTNPYANVDGLNAEQLYGVETFETRIPVSFSWHIASGGDRTTVQPIYGVTTASDAWKFTIQDQSGHEAYASWVSSAPSAAINITTSALNPVNDWKVYFATTNNDSKTEFSFMISDSQINANTTATVTYANL